MCFVGRDAGRGGGGASFEGNAPLFVLMEAPFGLASKNLEISGTFFLVDAFLFCSDSLLCVPVGSSFCLELSGHGLLGIRAPQLPRLRRLRRGAASGLQGGEVRRALRADVHEVPRRERGGGGFCRFRRFFFPRSRSPSYVFAFLGSPFLFH